MCFSDCETKNQVYVKKKEKGGKVESQRAEGGGKQWQGGLEVRERPLCELWGVLWDKHT